MIIIYNIIIYLIQPILWIKLLWRSIKTPGYCQRLTERYGFFYKKVQQGGILLHSVSVGETLTAIPLVYALRNRNPRIQITITSMTLTGSERVQSAFGKDIYHVYLPYDLIGAMNRFLNHINPSLVIIMETELWPNLIIALHRRNIPIVIANARLSYRSAERYKKVKNFSALIMKRITIVAAQNEEDGIRFLELGLKKSQLIITGSLKFDISITPEIAEKALNLRQKWAPQRQVWIATSTHDGEELLLLQVHRKLLKIFPNLLFVLVPRHPERFQEVQEMILKARFSYIMRSSGKSPSISTQVVIGDTMGELMLLYGIADLAFVGGSLINRGGHNPLEALAYAIPVLMGPYTLNFRDICRKLTKEGGLITVTDIPSLVKEISILLTNDRYRFYHGYHGIKVLHQNRGALQKLLKLLDPYLP